jgi:hypothetical protein
MLQPYVLSSNTSSFVTNSQTSSFVLNSVTSSMLTPYVLTSSTSSMSVATASYVLQAVSSSFAATASYLLNSGYNYKNTTLSANLTGSVVETQLLQVAIPANTFNASDVIKIFPTFIKSGTAGAVTIRLKFSTSSSMPSGTTATIASYSFGAAQSYVQMSRKMIVNGGNLYGYVFTTSAIDDVATITTAISSVAFDVAQQQYFYVSATLVSGSDLFNLRGVQITTQ